MHRNPLVPSLKAPADLLSYNLTQIYMCVRTYVCIHVYYMYIMHKHVYTYVYIDMSCR